MHAVINRTSTFTSSGRSIQLETFLPASPRPAPALLLLHGATGLMGGNRYIPQLAGALAEQGFATILVHYFDATGTSYADDTTIWKSFERWLQVISEAVGMVEAMPEIDAARLGLVGYSLGGYLAMAHASRDPRIRAVVEFAGGMDETFAQSVQRLPPTLIVHGEQDRRVPFREAKHLQAVLERVGAICETRFYPQDGHFFSPMAGLEALDAGVTFLRQHLGVEAV